MIATYFFKNYSLFILGQKYVMYQMKTVLSSIIRQMKIETLGSQDDIVIGAQLILRPESLPDIKITRVV